MTEVYRGYLELGVLGAIAVVFIWLRIQDVQGERKSSAEAQQVIVKTFGAMFEKLIGAPLNAADQTPNFSMAENAKRLERVELGLGELVAKITSPKCPWADSCPLAPEQEIDGSGDTP